MALKKTKKQEEEFLEAKRAGEEKGIEVATKKEVSIPKIPISPAHIKEKRTPEESQFITELLERKQERERLEAAEIPESLPELQDIESTLRTKEAMAEQERIEESSKIETPLIGGISKSLIEKGLEKVGGKQAILQTAAQSYFTVINAFKTKDVQVAQAEATFTDATTALNSVLSSVKEGKLNPIDAMREYESAVSAMLRLERYAHNEGKINLKFWVDKGAELEASIMKERAILERMRFDFDLAVQERMLAGVIKR